MSSYESFIALRHLKDRRTKFLSAITTIAIVGVFLGVMALTSVVAVTGGFQRAFQDRVLGINSHVLVIRYGLSFHDYRDFQKKLESLDAVKGTSPFILHEMIASQNRESSGVLVKGIDPNTMTDVSDIPRYLVGDASLESLAYDRFPEDGQKETPRILIGETLADNLGLEVGDLLRVTSPLKHLDPGRTEDSGQPTSREFRVAGLYRSGFHEYDSRLILTDFRALQEFFDRGDVVNGIDIRVHDPFGAPQLVEKTIDPMLPDTKFNVLDWTELNHNLFTSLKLQRVVLAILFCFIVLVASFNIVCTLIMIVLDKKKDIAILKAMGATKWHIMKIFMYQGSLIGAVGTINGVVGGLGVCLLIQSMDFGLDPEIYMIDHLPVDIRPLEFLAVAVVAMLISLLATLGPAWWASRLNPVDGLRYEG